ncbi:MAG: hypothetical protein LV473_16710 [Nitrospira sp.]|nr:hypothetical protein [Nitrospira sp.]
MVHRFRYILFIAMLGGLFIQIAGAGEHPAPKSLWQTIMALPPTGQPSVRRKSWVLREREIVLDLPLLRVLKDAGARPLPRITVELFDKPDPELDVVSTVSRINDTAVIRGTFTLPSVGDFTFVVTGNLLTGTIQMRDRLYKIEHTANGRLQLIEVDPGNVPSD